jgi:hypothetical protein
VKHETPQPAVEERAEEVPPEWQVSVRHLLKEDGRYLIYYDFAPGPAAPEVELQSAEELAG